MQNHTNIEAKNMIRIQHDVLSKQGSSFLGVMVLILTAFSLRVFR
ncbi:MAG: hypothetical protein ACI9TH_000790 [Kiritimatiellia bacterium]|jgi:hypothetical protein